MARTATRRPAAPQLALELTTGLEAWDQPVIPMTWEERGDQLDILEEVAALPDIVRVAHTLTPAPFVSPAAPEVERVLTLAAATVERRDALRRLSDRMVDRDGLSPNDPAVVLVLRKYHETARAVGYPMDTAD